MSHPKFYGILIECANETFRDMGDAPELSYKDMNDGWCDAFAEYVHDIVPEAEPCWATNITENFYWKVSDKPDCYGNHCFLLYEGIFYDSECMEGTNDYRYLPFFQRQIPNKTN
jgi:hypothetical protein